MKGRGHGQFDGMTEGVLTILGGIGLFLFGMKTMTEALREAAGGSLRRLLARFTTSPTAGVLTGAAVTAVVQSSTATTVMTVGFVGAGLLSFPQALGVLYGANIGTTVTGWMITLLGFKLQLGTVAQPVLLGAALLSLLGRGQAGRMGRMLAGLCVLFIGLDLMQAGVAGAENLLTPDMLPASDGLAGRLGLVLIGILATQLLQSSTAGVALALVFLGAGAIGFAQAMALVVGINIGTTSTAVLASIGGSAAMRQTALAHVLFNLVTAALVFPFLGPLAPMLQAMVAEGDDQTALVLFHSGFSLLGMLIFLPLTGRFARLVERLVRERAGDMTEGLDRSLLEDEAAALDAARGAAMQITARVFSALGAALKPGHDLRGLSALSHQAEPALVALEDFLTRIRVPEDNARALERYSAMLHHADHLARLCHRAGQRQPLSVLASDPVLRRAALALGETLNRAVGGSDETARLARLVRLIGARVRRHRHAMLSSAAPAREGGQEIFRRTDAMRWLLRIASNAERIGHYASVSR